MAGSSADEEDGNRGLTTDDVKALIAEGRSGLREELKKEFEAEAERKATHFEGVIASQAKQIADLHSA